MIHNIHLMPKYYDLILKGDKILEGRVNDEKRKSFQVGDLIKIISNDDESQNFLVEIEDIYHFADFEDMLNSVDKEALGFKDKTKEELLDIYNGIYDHKEVITNGVVVFKIKVI